jgi:hypothetical protein
MTRSQLIPAAIIALAVLGMVMHNNHISMGQLINSARDIINGLTGN